MSSELNLMIRLRDGSDSGVGPPIVVCRGAADSLAQSLPKGALLVFHGDRGWVASDSNTGQIVPLGQSGWSRLGEWELRLSTEGSAGGDQDPYAAEYEGSILENNSGISGWLIVHDQSADGGDAHRAYLPTRDGSVVTIGRSADAKITLRDKSVSRQHLRLTLTSGRFWMENLGKYSPTVNGRTADKRTRLAHGDTIGVGKSTLIFNNPSELADARAANPPSSAIGGAGTNENQGVRDLPAAPSNNGTPPRRKPADLKDRPLVVPPPAAKPSHRVDPIQVALATAIVLVIVFIIIALLKL